MEDVSHFPPKPGSQESPFAARREARALTSRARTATATRKLSVTATFE
jgi:hypothetical protein